VVETDSVNFILKNKQILKDITIQAQNGETIAIIGPNGAGKTTFLKMLRAFLSLTSGNIYIVNKLLEEYDNKELSKLIAYLPQTTKAVACSVEDCILLGRKPHIKYFPSAEDYKKIHQIMEELHLTKFQGKNVLNLSGGELQKVLIARSLVQESNILFLDEPINHLDIKNQLEIMDVTKEMTLQRDLVTFIVLHDLNLAFKYADKILLLQNGHNKFYGNKENLTEDILSNSYGVKINLINFNGVQKVIY